LLATQLAALHRKETANERSHCLKQAAENIVRDRVATPTRTKRRLHYSLQQNDLCVLDLLHLQPTLAHAQIWDLIAVVVGLAMLDDANNEALRIALRHCHSMRVDVYCCPCSHSAVQTFSFFKAFDFNSSSMKNRHASDIFSASSLHCFNPTQPTADCQ
jgi:hypothetical protein